MGWQVVKYIVMFYCDIVIDCNSIKFFCNVFGSFDIVSDQLIYVFKVNVVRYKLSERVCNGNNRFIKVFIFYVGSMLKCVCICYVVVLSCGCRL